MGLQIQLQIPHLQHIGENVLQLGTGIPGAADVLGLDDLSQLFRCLGGSLHAQVSQNQALLQLIEEVVVNLVDIGENLIEGAADGVSGFSQALFDFVKKTHLLIPF